MDRRRGREVGFEGGIRPDLEEAGKIRERPGGFERNLTQSLKTKLTAGNPDESRLVFIWNFKRFGQQPGELFRRPSVPRFDFPQGTHGAAGALCQLVLGHVERFATAFEPFIKNDRRGLFLHFGFQNCSTFWGSAWDSN